MRAPVRIALVVVGLVPVMYGTARMSGGWLGVPPRWATDPTDAGLILRDLRPPPTPGVMTMIPLIPSAFPGFEPCVRDWTSLGMIAVGTGLIMTGALSQRRPVGKPRAPRPA